MTTDITELAQREKFEAWAEHACAAPWGYLKKRRTTEGYSEQIYTCMWTAWKAANAELVEAVEKAQRANAAQDDHINQQQDRIEQLEKRNADLGKHVGMLEKLLKGVEESLIASTDMVTELESRTVKLPADNAAESESPENDASAWFDEGWNARGKADKEALTAAGIKVEGE